MSFSTIQKSLPPHLQRLMTKGEYVHTGMLIIGGIFTWFFFNSYFSFLAKAYVTLRVMKCLYIISKSFVVHRVMPEMDISHLRDTWTVVTGGTDGIGKAYTLEMARSRGIRRFVLIGRNAQKLTIIETELKKDFKCEVKTIIFDFDGGDWAELTNELKDLDIGILLNFAGLAPGMVGNLVEQEEGLASRIMQVNTISCVRMNELVLPKMIEKDRGIIVNMSSMTGLESRPGFQAESIQKFESFQIYTWV
ncbi:unnamed protein product, partial [Mesorhabditis belari]|uniref:Uncharacterized protein n=1 Tax=Mesorhabditis belari TaxID=2138241 RepID=A0AAF3FP94_9BILA